MRSTIAVALAVSTLSASLFAAPAAWHQWRSKTDGTLVCAQTSPGEAWEKIPAAYKDARCKEPVAQRKSRR